MAIMRTLPKLGSHRNFAVIDTLDTVAESQLDYSNTRTNRANPCGSMLAAWSDPHIALSNVMWRSTNVAPITTAASVVCKPTSWPL